MNSELFLLRRSANVGIAKLDMAIQKGLGFPRLKRRFRQRLGRKLNLKNPKSFNEKVQWRKVFDHDERFVRLTDKVECRRFIAEELGAKPAADLLVPILGEFKSPSHLPISDFKDGVVIKASHGSSMNLLLPKGTKLNQKKIKRICARWLRTVHGYRKFEWAYLSIPPALIVEPFVEDLHDIKLYCFDGEPKFVFASKRQIGHGTYHIEDGSWRHDGGNFSCRQPIWFAEMREIARLLSRKFDMLRVDFLVTKDRFFLGELTVYSTSGFGIQKTPEQDEWLGEEWSLQHLKTST